MKRIILGVFLSFLFLQCNQANSIYPDPQIININSKNSINHSVLDIAEIVKIIRLETTKESLIGTIEKLLYHSGRFYILDTKTKTVKSFSENGNYIGNIGLKGNGPNEYVDPGDIAFSNDRKCIAILDGDISRTILCYDLEGNFIKKIKLPHYFSRFQMISENKFVLYKDNASFDNELFNMYTINDQGKIISKDFKYDKKLIGLNYLTHNILYDYQGKINLVLPFERTIFAIENEHIIPHIKLDFSDKNMTEEDYIALFEKSNSNIHGFNQQVRQIDKVWCISSFTRNKDWIYFIYNQGNEEYGLYHKMSSTETYRFNLNSIRCFYNRLVPRAHMGNDKFINVLYPYTLKTKSNLSFRLEYMKKNYPEAYMQYKEELSNLKIDDNPVLLITKMK